MLITAIRVLPTPRDRLTTTNQGTKSVMAKNILRHCITKYGNFEVETIINPTTEELFVSVPSIERMLDWGANNGRKKLAAKKLKTFAGGSFTTGKNINCLDKIGKVNRCTVIPFSDLLTVLYWELKNDNPNAERLLLAGFADSFTSQAFEQAGIEYSLEKRKELLAFYLVDYHELFDWIRDAYLEKHGTKPPHAVYQAINKAINTHLFGKEHFNANRRKNATSRELRDLENCQRFAMRKIKQNNLTGDPLDIVPGLVKQY